MRWPRPAPDRAGDSRTPLVVASPKPDRLLSWKEIAAYLRHGVRTVQRWEETEGLPVHRHPHEKRDSVYAYPPELDAWWTSHQARLEPAQPIHTSPPPRGPLLSRLARRRRAWAVVGAAFAALAVSAGVWMRWGVPLLGPPALSFAKRDWVLIADFDNQTGDPMFDRSLLTAFTVSLEQSPHANVLPRTRISAALQRMGKTNEARIDEQAGREICLREHVKGLITCGITRAGQEYALSARLIDPQTGAAVRSYFEPARNQDKIIEALGKITRAIRRDLGESLGSIRQSEPLPQVTTTSLQALTMFSEGNFLWRRGQYKEAVKAYQSALEHDADFAMAHGALGNAYLSHIFNNEVQGKEQYEKALRRADRITDRERLYLQASYHHYMGHVDEAVQYYQLYLNAYPDDAEARFGFGVHLMRNARNEEAAAAFQEVLRVDPRHARAWINLAVCQGALGKHREALADYAKAFELEPSWVTLGNLNHEYGFALVCGGDTAKAREVFAAALAKPDMRSSALRSLALLDMYEGRYRDAKARLRQAIALNEAEHEYLRKARDHVFLAILLDGQGDRAGQVKELDRAVEALANLSGPAVWLNSWIGAAYARAGAIGKAGQILGALSSRADRQSPMDLSDLNLLAGELALARGDYPSAIGKLRLAAQGLHLPMGLVSLAFAYQKNGDTGEAIASYEKLADMESRVLGWEPQQPWLRAHADLAEAYLSRGESAKAARALDVLAKRWREADPDLPLARRMAGLWKRLPIGDR